MKTAKKLLLAACAAASLHCAGELAAGAVEYPAQGLFDVDEGTIEIWFAPMTELYVPDKGSYEQVLQLLSVQAPGNFNLNCAWYRHGEQLGLKASLSDAKVKGGMTALIGGAPQGWRSGETHRVAFRWQGRETALFADGKRISGKTQMSSFSGPLGGVDICVGSPKGDCKMLLKAVRISSVARDDEELASSKPEPDMATALLDVFGEGAKQSKGQRSVPALTLSADENGKTGAFKGAVGLSPEGAALYKRQ